MSYDNSMETIYNELTTAMTKARAPKHPMKILVTGDRMLQNYQMVETIIAYIDPTVVVHGGARGADTLAAEAARTIGATVKKYRADWNEYGRAAGPIRNQQMIDDEHTTEEPIDMCVAFHDRIKTSRGTKDMVRRALRAKIPTILVRPSHPDTLIVALTELESDLR